MTIFLEIPKKQAKQQPVYKRIERLHRQPLYSFILYGALCIMLVA
jgi:hypothetical protein